MSSAPNIAHRDLAGKVRGDSWRGIGLIQIRTKATAEATPVAPPNAVASAVIQFKTKQDDQIPALTLSTESGGIVILDAALWRFNIPRVINFPLGAGIWVWDFETTDVTGFVRTYLKGTLTITRDVTRP